MTRPGHRHRPWTRHVAINDRRLDAAAAVGLHPAVLRERKAGQLLAEIFDHVVAFGFAVHQDVEPQRFLFLDGMSDLVPHGSGVTGLAERARLETGTRMTDLRRLRKRADGRGGKIRQLETRTLHGLANRERAVAHVVNGSQGGHPRSDRRVVHAR